MYHLRTFKLLRGLEPLTCWLRISCSTNWATVASRIIIKANFIICKIFFCKTGNLHSCFIFRNVHSPMTDNNAHPSGGREYWSLLHPALFSPALWAAIWSPSNPSAEPSISRSGSRCSLRGNPQTRFCPALQ